MKFGQPILDLWWDAAKIGATKTPGVLKSMVTNDYGDDQSNDPALQMNGVTGLSPEKQRQAHRAINGLPAEDPWLPMDEASVMERRNAFAKNYPLSDYQNRGRQRDPYAGLGQGLGQQEEPQSQADILKEIRAAIRLNPNQRARTAKQANTIVNAQYMPKIREARQTVTDLQGEEKRALDYADNAYIEAASEIQKYGNKAARMNRRNAKQAAAIAKANRGTAVAADAQAAVKQNRRSAQSNRDYTNKILGGLPAEQAIQESALKNAFAENIAQAKSDLNALKGERQANIAATRMELRDKARERNYEIYTRSLEIGDQKTADKAAAWEIASKFGDVYSNFMGQKNARRKTAKTLLTMAEANDVDQRTVLSYLKKNRQYDNALIRQLKKQAQKNAQEKAKEGDQEYLSELDKRMSAQKKADDLGIPIDLLGNLGR